MAAIGRIEHLTRRGVDMNALVREALELCGARRLVTAGYVPPV